MEQLSFISSAKEVGKSKELMTFEIVEPHLKKILLNDNISPDSVYFWQSKAETSRFSSVYAFNENTLLFRISFRGKQPYIALSSRFEKLIPDNIEIIKRKSDNEYFRIPITSPESIVEYVDLLCEILSILIDTYPTEFGCCSHYEECSDVRKCIHPDQKMPLGCAYRKNLKMGKIFYGANKTI